MSPQPFSSHNSSPRYTYKRFLVLFPRFWSVNQISCIQKQKNAILKLVTISIFIVFRSGCSRRKGLSKSHNSRLTWSFVAIYISILVNLDTENPIFTLVFSNFEDNIRSKASQSCIYRHYQIRKQQCNKRISLQMVVC